MDQSQLFNNRAYLFEVPPTEDENFELIKKIFSSLDESPPIKSAQFITSTSNYDIYKVSAANKLFNLKLSFSDQCSTIHRENKNLKLIDYPIAPKSLQSGKIKIGEQIHYSITSFENADKVSDVGRFYLMENLNFFLDSYSIINKSKNPNNKFIESLTDYFEHSQIEDGFFSHALDAIDQYFDLELIKTLFSDIHTEASDIYDVSIFEKDYFCHGDLIINNIITRNNLFKFINFDYSHAGNPMIDLSKIILSIGLKHSDKKSFINEFCSKINYKFNQKEYDVCEAMNLLLLLYKHIIDFMYEVYMFESERQGEICRIVADYTQNLNNFIKLPFFHKYSDFISKTITQPILNISPKKV